MGQINVKRTTIRKKNPSQPQKKITARRVVINNQVQKFNKAAGASRSNR